MSWGHIHLLLNHVPVIGTGLALLLLLVAFGRKSDELKKVTLGLFVLIALVAIPVYLTGEPAEEMVENIPGVAKAMIDRHEDAALFSLIAVEVTGIIALAGLLLFRTKGLGNLLAIVTLAFSVITGGLMAWTSNLGGQIRHTEISSGVAAESQTETDKSGRDRKDSENEREEH